MWRDIVARDPRNRLGGWIVGAVKRNPLFAEAKLHFILHGAKYPGHAPGKIRIKANGYHLVGNLADHRLGPPGRTTVAGHPAKDFIKRHRRKRHPHHPRDQQSKRDPRTRMTRAVRLRWRGLPGWLFGPHPSPRRVNGRRLPGRACTPLAAARTVWVTSSSDGMNNFLSSGRADVRKLGYRHRKGQRHKNEQYRTHGVVALSQIALVVGTHF